MPHYKIVRRTPNGLESAVASGAASTLYHVNTPTTAQEWLAKEGHHLCVFNALAHAERFLLCNSLVSPEESTAEVWECECEEEVVLPQIKNLLYLADKVFKPTYIIAWPVGTRMFKKITLIKKVDALL